MRLLGPIVVCFSSVGLCRRDLRVRGRSLVLYLKDCLVGGSIVEVEQGLELVTWCGVALPGEDAPCMATTYCSSWIWRFEAP